MPPVSSSTAALPQLERFLTSDANTTDTLTTSEYLAAQWHNPSDILSVLLLLGPDIVQGAIAQIAGRIVTPIAFSFGWMAYAARALLAATGGSCQTPTRRIPLSLGPQSGHYRTMKTWILSKLLSDFDNRIDEEMKYEQAHDPPSETGEPTQLAATRKSQDSAAQARLWEALRVSIFEVDENPPCKHGVPTLDWVWFSGFIVILVQLAISILPWIINGEWAIFMITLTGNALALIGASLPQWSQEKWACPKTGGSTVTLTQGNGSRHAVVILGRKGVGLDFEILARGTRTAKESLVTRTATAVLALLWIVLLVNVSGLKQNTWYLLGIGLLGSVQNLIAAGAARTPNALNHTQSTLSLPSCHWLHTEVKQTVCKPKHHVPAGLGEPRFPVCNMTIIADVSAVKPGDSA
ncbi:hypothetical protein K469DRAFT_751827 [Zopfia rhizophila CBS 207.26]|uniref:Uncharacterized protein n=1 Tax=Zopfia rhizophila CBS 207.26 TaxID=1314779 RepID=A0A6A6DXG3_9PEZI|nr:hypothetical protein K469DRAFT_751827 [Zopfia rhizophila CBS 207.26]